MRLRFSLMISAAVAVAALALPATQAGAAQVLTIETDQSQMVILPALPGSVVIGNPTIADATVEGTKLFIHGRGFGTTNLLILDLSGNEMASFDVFGSNPGPATRKAGERPISETGVKSFTAS